MRQRGPDRAKRTARCRWTHVPPARLLAGLVLACLACGCGRGIDDPLLAASGPAPGARTVVVAELFTSEGCSSCPPADDVLRQLVTAQPIENVEVLALGEHVDYWDGLGWRDPYSSAAFSRRQAEYQAQNFRTESIYTPQLVIDGRFQEIGSDRVAVRKAIDRAARLPKADVSVAATRTRDSDMAQVTVRVDIPPTFNRNDLVDVTVSVVEDGLATDVQRGENTGRRLRHAAVTRSLAVVDTLERQDDAWEQTVAIPLDPAWIVPNLRIIAFAQERRQRHILGAASATLTAP